MEDAVFAGQREIVVFALAALGAGAGRDGAQDPVLRAMPSRWWRWPGTPHLTMRMAFKIQGLIMKLPGRRIAAGAGRRAFPADAGRDALASRLFQYRA